MVNYKPYDIYITVRYAVKNVCLVGQKNLLEGQVGINMLVFKSAPLKMEVTLSPSLKEGDSKKAKSKVVVSAESKSEAYTSHISFLLDALYEEVEGDDEKLSIRIKEKLQAEFGPQWHVVIGKFGDLHVEYKALNDDYFEAKVGSDIVYLVSHYS